MSLRPAPIGPVPEETARVARAAFPKGSVYLRLRDELGAVYEDEAFAPLFPARGQPAEAPWRLALVTVMQFAEGLSDRQAADAVRGRLDWKYTLGLELTDPGFDFSVLSEFRSRLLAGGAEQRLLDLLLARCQAASLLRAGGRQRTDSTHVLAAVRALNRLEAVGETLRHALNALAVAAPDWLRAVVAPDWFERYAVRFENDRLPKTPAEREALALTIGADGFRLLGAVYGAGAAAPGWLRELPAVETLRRVWVQQYAVADGRPRWRTAAELPPAGRRQDSPYEPDARFSRKRDTTWVGYKVHLTETCDDDAPSLITDVQTTGSTTADAEVTAPVQAALAARGLLPGEHLADAGYVDADLLVSSRAEYGIDLVGPVRPDSSWQGRAGAGYDSSRFAIDWDARSVTCPHGRRSRTWTALRDTWGNEVFHVKFARRDCVPCPAFEQCTRGAVNRHRALTFRHRAQHEALQAARERQTTADYKARYAKRAGVEGALSQGTRAFGLRRCRYIGLPKTRLQHLATAAAINLARLDAWWTETPRAPTRCSAFARLALAS